MDRLSLPLCVADIRGASVLLTLEFVLRAGFEMGQDPTVYLPKLGLGWWFSKGENWLKQPGV